ncbi:MAG: hypothetical protein PHU85_17955 [Phycisphaerae bacterium]|nr:hypothetical protein [Phycisphaerae bacterium]
MMHPNSLAMAFSGEFVVSVIAGVFLVFYGIGLWGRPYDVTRGVRVLERMAPRTRAAVGILLVIGGLFMLVTSWWWSR